MMISKKSRLTPEWRVCTRASVPICLAMACACVAQNIMHVCDFNLACLCIYFIVPCSQ